VRDKCACKRGFTVRWPAGWNSAEVVEKLTSREVPPDLADDILSQLFKDSDEVLLQTVDGSVVTPGSASQDYSAVFKVWPEGRLQPRLTKFASIKQIQTEAQNYKKYVRGNLGGQFHAILEDEPVTFWDLGGLLYSFIGASQEELTTFSKYYKKTGKLEAIISPLHHFFKHVWINFYEDAEELEDRTLFQAYDKVFKLENRLSNYSNQADYLLFESLQLSLRNPVTWVLKHHQASVFHRMRQAITHGDLHGENIFVNAAHAWAIDFGRTGPGHILRDFAELEVDIFTRIVNVPEESFDSLLSLALALVGSKRPGAELTTELPLSENVEISKAFSVVGELRKLALEVAHCRDAREYYWSLLFDALFVATMDSENVYKQKKALLLAAVICARLRNWGLDGPSERWLKA